jgi:hypothetical protein
MLALRATGNRNDKRFTAAREVVFDRMIDSGGWNYGNSRMFGSSLRPFPATTGIMLTALAGEPINKQIASSIDYLADEIVNIRTPLSLSWGLIGLTTWGKRPAAADDWLSGCIDRRSREPFSPLDDALLLLAASPSPISGLTGSTASADATRQMVEHHG